MPLLFMGEEWGETRPFRFFTDFHGELGDAVREGRRREFAKWPHFADRAAQRADPRPERGSDLHGFGAATGANARAARRIASGSPSCSGCWPCGSARSCRS